MTELTNASSFDPLSTPSFKEVYGDVESNEVYKLLTEGSMLPEGFRDIQVWRDLSEAIDEVLGEQVGSLIKDLFGMNEVGYVTRSPSIDKQTLLKQARKLGVTSDLSTFTTDDIRHFIRYSPEFWKEKGGRNFIQYASFVINAVPTMNYTWTEDYDTFLREGSVLIGPPVYEGGTFYPTSHVFLSYDIEKFRGSVNANFSSQQALTKFFYSIAPIHLVIKSFLLSQNIDAIVYLAGDVQMRVWDAEERNPTALTNTFNRKDVVGAVGLLNSNLTLYGTADELSYTPGSARSVKSESSRKVYLEFHINSMSPGHDEPLAGLCIGTTNLATAGSSTGAWVLHAATGDVFYNGVATSLGTTFAAGDTIRMFWDSTTLKLWFGKNATWLGGGDPAAGTSPTFTGVAGPLFAMASVCNNESLITLAEGKSYRFPTPSGGVKFGS